MRGILNRPDEKMYIPLNFKIIIICSYIQVTYFLFGTIAALLHTKIKYFSGHRDVGGP